MNLLKLITSLLLILSTHAFAQGETTWTGRGFNSQMQMCESQVVKYVDETYSDQCGGSMRPDRYKYSYFLTFWCGSNEDGFGKNEYYHVHENNTAYLESSIGCDLQDEFKGSYSLKANTLKFQFDDLHSYFTEKENGDLGLIIEWRGYSLTFPALK